MEGLRGLRIVVLVAFLALIGFSMGDMLQPLVTQSMKIGPLQVGLLFFLLNMVSSALRIPVGLASDKYGRRRFITIAAMFMAASGFLFTRSEGFDQLVVPFVFWGIGGALYWTTIGALIADLTSERTRIKAYGATGIFEVFAWLMGPLIGGLASDRFGIRMAFVLLSVLSVVTTVSSLKLPDSSRRTEQANAGMGVREALFGKAARVVGAFSLLNMIHGTYAAMMWTAFPIYLKTVLGLTYSEIGWLSAVSSLGNALALLCVSRLPHRALSLKFLMAVSMVPSGLLTVGYTMVRSLIWLFPVAFVSGFFLAFGAQSAISSTLFVNSLSESARGAAFGVTGTVWRFGMASGSVILGAIWSAYEITTVFYVCSALLLLQAMVVWILVPENTHG